MPVYACVDNQGLVEVPEEYEIPGQDELSIKGHSYRRLDPVFLAWIDSCVRKMVSDPHADTNYVGGLIAFLDQCNSTGVKPCDSRAIPAGYRKPNIAEQLDWLNEIEWE